MKMGNFQPILLGILSLIFTFTAAPPPYLPTHRVKHLRPAPQCKPSNLETLYGDRRSNQHGD
jgi:hypothetical protein